MSDLQGLLAVQDRDTEIDQLKHRRATLPERAELAKIEAESADVDRRGAEIGGHRDGLEGRRAELEVEVTELERRTTDVDRRLRSGDVTATRELTAMVEQLDGLRRRRAVLEDEELELMVALEPFEAELAGLEARRAELTKAGEEVSSRLVEVEAAVDIELAAANQARGAAAEGVPEPLLTAYERLRGRLGGTGAARLVGSSCGGCHLALSATEVDRLRRSPPDAVLTCENCGRILVR